MRRIAASLLFVIGLSCLAVGIRVGLETVRPIVTPATVHLGNGYSCGSALNPEAPPIVFWNGGYTPKYHVQSCGSARHDNLVATVGFGVVGGILVLAALVVWFARLPARDAHQSSERLIA